MHDQLESFANSDVTGTIQCRACQSYIEVDGDFCEYCGARVTAENIEARVAPAGAQTIKPAHRIVIVVVVLLLASIVALLRFGAKAEQPNEQVAIAAATATPPEPEQSKPTPLVAPPGMIFIPGGTFQMGRSGGDNYEQPVHEVIVSAFYIDQLEVTCADYAKFIQETNHPAPPGWSNNKPAPGTALLPVTGVNWADANAYAQWAGKRLPTEEEWEFAARGNTAWIYPWGNEWKPNCANAAGSAAGKITDVGSYPDGKSPFGVLDMVGNVWEWTASKFKPYPGGSLPSSTGEDLMVIRGNFWKADQNQATTTYRRGYPATNEDYTNTGFRCAKNAGA